MPRVAFLGMDSAYSVRPLQGLLNAGVEVALCLKPVGGVQTRGRTYLRRDHGITQALRHQVLPGAEQRDPFITARRHGIPTYLVGNASSVPVIDLLRKAKIELMVIAFFNQLLKPEVFQWMPLGAINAHPSLLPKDRGPSPLFWTFHRAALETGVTVHQVAPGEDDGAILASQRLPLALGTTGEALIAQLAELNFELLPRVVHDVTTGCATPVAQDHTQATRAPRPTEADRTLSPALGARRLYALARGVGRWNALIFDTGSERLRILDAIAFEPGGTVPGDHARLGDALLVGCADGTVTFRVG